MSGAQHTPGPWHTNDDGIIRHSGKKFSFVKIGSPWREGAWTDEAADAATLANARLIAAAPNLLAFAERILANAEQMAIDRDTPPSSQRWWRICADDARAELVKATGNA